MDKYTVKQNVKTLPVDMAMGHKTHEATIKR